MRGMRGMRGYEGYEDAQDIEEGHGSGLGVIIENKTTETCVVTKTERRGKKKKKDLPTDIINQQRYILQIGSSSALMEKVSDAIHTRTYTYMYNITNK